MATEPPVAEGTGGCSGPKLVGVLALQGDVAEHVHVLERLGSRVRLVKTAADLEDLDGLIIPGGESTTMGKLLRRFSMLDSLRDMVCQGFPVYGTCAGMILLAEQVVGRGADQPGLRSMGVTVERNYFGTQVNSFERDIVVKGLNGAPFHAVFIRAPVIRRLDSRVEPLARLDDGVVVAARQGNLLVSAFHPELTDDLRMHALFLRMLDNPGMSGATPQKHEAAPTVAGVPSA